MTNNYKRLGDYIQLVDRRNTELKDLPLVGVSVTKNFIPSVANIIGTNMKGYKLIGKNQFACSLMQVRRDGKIPVALFEDDEAIISQAYPVFEIVDESRLLPQYLMMWMSRSEFDREACFYAVGGVRGSLEWDDFCGMSLPVPSIEKQREMVTEYQAIEKRIKLNEQMIQKLEETAQAIYRQWFVEFEFPHDFGHSELGSESQLKPYKSSGGEMVWCEELGKEIPRGWTVGSLSMIANKIYSGGTPSTEVDEYWNGEHYWLSSGETGSKYIFKTERTITLAGVKNSTTKKAKSLSTVVATAGQGKTRGQSALVFQEVYINQSVIAIEPMSCEYSFFIYLNVNSRYDELRNDSDAQSIRGSINSNDMKMLFLIVPPKDMMMKFHNMVSPAFDMIGNKIKQNYKLSETKEMLLSKMATVGV